MRDSLSYHAHHLLPPLMTPSQSDTTQSTSLRLATHSWYETGNNMKDIGIYFGGGTAKQANQDGTIRVVAERTGKSTQSLFGHDLVVIPASKKALSWSGKIEVERKYQQYGCMLALHLPLHLLSTKLSAVALIPFVKTIHTTTYLDDHSTTHLAITEVKGTLDHWLAGKPLDTAPTHPHVPLTHQKIIPGTRTRKGIADIEGRLVYTIDETPESSSYLWLTGRFSTTSPLTMKQQWEPSLGWNGHHGIGIGGALRSILIGSPDNYSKRLESYTQITLHYPFSQIQARTLGIASSSFTEPLPASHYRVSATKHIPLAALSANYLTLPHAIQPGPRLEYTSTLAYHTPLGSFQIGNTTYLRLSDTITPSGHLPTDLYLLQPQDDISTGPTFLATHQVGPAGTNTPYQLSNTPAQGHIQYTITSHLSFTRRYNIPAGTLSLQVGGWYERARGIQNDALCTVGGWLQIEFKG